MLQNVGLCNECNARVPCEYVKRDGTVWIRKTCPEHGVTEALVSTDAKAWQEKRDMWPYVTEEPKVCTLQCTQCKHNHKPNIAFIDLTNHCNMHCPICIATIRGMGFDYNPPLSYFEMLFQHISQWNPKPTVQLFGGEPTVREDLFEIIDLVRKYGMRPNVTTNGLKLADEEYCKKFCEARIGVRFSFDGFSPDIYEKLRHNAPAYHKKVKGLENLKKHTRRKQTIISCIARGINDGERLAELIQYCHDNRDWVNELALIPLADTWDPKEFDISTAHANTLESIEHAVMEVVGNDEVEYVPAGLSYALRLPRKFLRSNPRSEVLLLAGVHPNCESMTVLVSDGKRYRGINHYLKVPFKKAMKEFMELCAKIEPKLKKLDPDKPWQRFKGKVLVFRTLIGWGLRSVSLLKATNYNPPWALLKACTSGLRNKIAKMFHKGDKPWRRRRRLLRVAMLPFEEQHSVDACRLENCKAVFPYEDTDTGQIETIPTCMWPPYRDEVLRKVSQKYGVVDKEGNVKPAKFFKPEVKPAGVPYKPSVTQENGQYKPETEDSASEQAAPKA